MIRLLAFALLAIGVLASPASSQTAPSKIFVASTGNDANDGSRQSPKRSFQAAHDTVGSGGSIVVLDTAGYGRLSITKSVSVVVPPGVNGFITDTSFTPVVIAAGASDTVSLQGLIIEGGGNQIGVYVVSAGKLTIADCLIRNGSPGISVYSSTSMKIEIHRTTLQNGEGIYLTGAGSGVRVDAKLVDVVVQSPSNAGFEVGGANGGVAYALLTRCEASGTDKGIAVHPGGQIVADGCLLSGNNYAFYKYQNGGTIYTYKNNIIVFNQLVINGSNTTSPLDPL